MLYPTGFEIGDVFEPKEYSGSVLTRFTGNWVIAAKAMMKKEKLDRAPIIAIKEEYFHDHFFLKQKEIPVDPEAYLFSAGSPDDSSSTIQPFYFFTLYDVKIIKRADTGIPQDQMEALKTQWAVGTQFGSQEEMGVAGITAVSQILTRRSGFSEILIGMRDVRGDHSLLPLTKLMRQPMKPITHLTNASKAYGIRVS